MPLSGHCSIILGRQALSRIENSKANYPLGHAQCYDHFSAKCVLLPEEISYKIKCQ